MSPDRRANRRRRTSGFLIPFLLIGISAAAEPLTSDSGPSPAAASPAEEGPISVEELARRLQRLEKQNAKLAAQNDKLAEQNTHLTKQSQSLSGKLEQITKRYDRLNRRLDDLTPSTASKLSFPAVLAPSPSERPAAQKAPIIPDNLSPAFSTSPDTPSVDGTGANPDEPSANVESGPTQGSDTSPTTGTTRDGLSKFLIGGYDEERGGFVLVRSQDTQRVPFELRFDLVTQLRYTNFAPSASTWTDSTGLSHPIQRISSWEINRNFIQFSGFALDPRLQYVAILFSSTAINDTVLLGYIGYHFSDAFDLRAGNWLVPGTREWYTSFRYTLGADRTMATTFFRPNISPGIWAQGEPIKGLNYVAMLANSLNRFNQGIDRIGSSFAFGGTVRWEPLGDFGRGPSDVENHQSLSTRLGVNLAASRESNQGSIFNDGVISDPRLPNPEDTIIRLSNGTPLFRANALGAGVTLTAPTCSCGPLTRPSNIAA